METATRVFWTPDLIRRYGCDRTTIWRWRSRGDLPAPDIEIAGRPGWYESTILKFETDHAPKAGDSEQRAAQASA